MPMYEVSTINGKMLGFGEPIRVKQGERILMHILNSSPTEVHWIALAGHTFQVVALDGNPVARSANSRHAVPRARRTRLRHRPDEHSRRLGPGEVRKHVQAAGMGIVVEYANATGAPKWMQPPRISSGTTRSSRDASQRHRPAVRRTSSTSRSPSTQSSKATATRSDGHINGKSYPDTESPLLQAGKRYRLVMKNLSNDDHPIHLHRHTFEVTRVGEQRLCED